jgi:DNA polymerase I-like protein with 3'-5' exonuclease and polymerase domains
MKATIADAYRLFHEGTIALASVEEAGARIDTDYLDAQIEALQVKIDQLSEKLKASKTFDIWRKHFGRKARLGSRQQLGHIIFGVLKYECKSLTATLRPRVTEKALEDVDLPFVKRYIKLEKLKKTRNTYLKGIRREVVDGFLHPVYNLNIPRTYRGSCQLPNFQNFPVRNKMLSLIVRSCIIPRAGRQIAEIDFKGIEVSVAYCYHQDPEMGRYLNDPASDLHRDMAVQVYKLKEQDIDKDVRYCAKNMFVFPQFYGSYYVDCAKDLWGAVKRMNLKKVDGTPLTDHLKAKGFKKLGKCDPDLDPEPGTFEHHVKLVEDHFWTARFPTYARWKRRWYDRYLRRGWFDLLTGFRIEGDYRRNQVINYPVQGAAFHCLLFCLIQLEKWLRKNKMLTVIIGQIHDSIILDLVPGEAKAVFKYCRWLMTEELPRVWRWIKAPMQIEIEVAPVNKSWFMKEKVA